MRRLEERAERRCRPDRTRADEQSRGEHEHRGEQTNRALLQRLAARAASAAVRLM
jgi:hypothetical protein